MPQISKRGKYIFGWSIVRENGLIRFPDEAIKEYKLTEETFIYIVSGSKQTGGFCVMPAPLFSKSKLQHILKENESLAIRVLEEGQLLSYKGRKYGYLSYKNNFVKLTEPLMQILNIKIGDKLLSIRSSDIAFTMGHKGVLIEKALAYDGEIKIF